MTGRQSRPVTAQIHVQTCTGIQGSRDPEDPGSWILGSWGQGSWGQDPGSWILGSGSWVQDPGVQDPGVQDPGFRIQDPGGHGIPGSWILDPGQGGWKPPCGSLDPSAIQTPHPGTVPCPGTPGTERRCSPGMPRPSACPGSPRVPGTADPSPTARADARAAACSAPRASTSATLTCWSAWCTLGTWGYPGYVHTWTYQGRGIAPPLPSPSVLVDSASSRRACAARASILRVSPLHVPAEAGTCRRYVEPGLVPGRRPGTSVTYARGTRTQRIVTHARTARVRSSSLLLSARAASLVPRTCDGWVEMNVGTRMRGYQRSLPPPPSYHGAGQAVRSLGAAGRGDVWHCVRVSSGPVTGRVVGKVRAKVVARNVSSPRAQGARGSSTLLLSARAARGTHGAGFRYVY